MHMLRGTQILYTYINIKLRHHYVILSTKKIKDLKHDLSLANLVEEFFQFLVEGFVKPLCLDRSRNGGEIMLFIKLMFSLRPCL